MQTKEISQILLSIFRSNPFRVVPPKRIIPGVILLLGLALLLYQSLVSQQIIRLKAMKFQSYSQKKLLDYKYIIARDPSILLERLKKTENKFNELKSRFVVEQALPKYFDKIRELINKTDNRLTSLDLKSATPIIDPLSLGKNNAEYYQRLPFSMAVNGDYVGALMLLNRIENDSYLMEISNIKIEATQKTAAEVLLNLEMNLYVLKE